MLTSWPAIIGPQSRTDRGQKERDRERKERGREIEAEETEGKESYRESGSYSQKLLGGQGSK